MTSVECLKKRDREKGPSEPDQKPGSNSAQYLSIEIYFIEKILGGRASVLILIQQDCLETYCLCLCPISWNCHKVTRFGGSSKLFYFLPN